MRVLFLALGATRRRETIAESARVVAAGGHAAILVDQARAWRRETFPDGVEVIDLGELRLRHLPWRVEHLLLFRAPAAAIRAAGRGPLSAFSRRAVGAYRQRIARPVHRRVFVPAYERIWRDAPRRLVERHALSGPSYDVMVVHDPMSIPMANRLIDGGAFGRHTGRPVRFGLDPVPGGAPAAAGGPGGDGR